jgi:hypothetical protein
VLPAALPKGQGDLIDEVMGRTEMSDEEVAQLLEKEAAAEEAQVQADGAELDAEEAFLERQGDLFDEQDVTITAAPEAAPEAVPITAIPTDKAGLRVWGRALGIGPSAEILKETSLIAGKDTSNPEDARAVINELKVYLGKGKKSENIQTNVNNLIAELEQVAAPEVVEGTQGTQVEAAPEVVEGTQVEGTQVEAAPEVVEGTQVEAAPHRSG